MNPASTFHTYPQTHADPGRPCRTDWGDRLEHSAQEAINATLRHDSEAIVVAAIGSNGESVRGHYPMGLGAK